MRQKYFVEAFGAGGTTTPAVPDATDPSGFVSYTTGFTFDYQRNLLTDALAKSPTYVNFNAILHDITAGVQALQQAGAPEWITSANNGGAAFSYGLGSLVLYSSSGNPPFNLYMSTENGNTDTPGTSANWFNLSTGLPTAANGQCRLTVGGTTTLVLKPFNGNNIVVNNQSFQIPNAGVTYTASGLSASILYYVYIEVVSGVLTLLLSTTGHATAANGIEVMNGDPTKSLVGMVYTNTSSQFVFTSAQPWLLNWFNRQLISVGSTTTSNSTSSTSQVPLGPTEIVLLWAGTSVNLGLYGQAFNSTAGAGGTLQLDVNGSATNSTSAIFTSITANMPCLVVAQNGGSSFSEGIQNITVYGATSGTGTITTDTSVQGYVFG